MNRKNSHTTSNQVSPDTKSFYEYVTDKKSSFLNPFTSSTKPPRSSSNGSNGSIMSAAEHNDFMFKSNGNYTVNSIGASEIGEINENRSNGINSSGTNSQHSITSNSPKMTRGSSSKVYNLLGMEPFILFSYLYDYNYFFINLYHDSYDFFSCHYYLIVFPLFVSILCLCSSIDNFANLHTTRNSNFATDFILPAIGKEKGNKGEKYNMGESERKRER